jgi:hypothetical protein
MFAPTTAATEGGVLVRKRRAWESLEWEPLTFDVAMEDVVTMHIMKTREQLLRIAADMTRGEDLEREDREGGVRT